MVMMRAPRGIFSPVRASGSRSHRKIRDGAEPFADAGERDERPRSFPPKVT